MHSYLLTAGLLISLGVSAKWVATITFANWKKDQEESPRLLTDQRPKLP